MESEVKLEDTSQMAAGEVCKAVFQPNPDLGEVVKKIKVIFLLPRKQKTKQQTHWNFLIYCLNEDFSEYLHDNNVYPILHD